MVLDKILQEGQKITLFEGEEVVSVLESSTVVPIPHNSGVQFRNCAILEPGEILFFPLTLSRKLLDSYPIKSRAVEGNKVTYLFEGGLSYTLEFEGVDMDALLAEDRLTDYITVGNSNHMVPPFPKSL